jgi:O-antigen/teichoic acid export membrane protein
LIIREVARDPQSTVSLYWPVAALAIQIVLSLLLIVIIWLLPEQQVAMRLYSLALIPLAFSTVYSAVLRGHERMDLYLMFAVASAALQALVITLVLLKGGSLPVMMASLVGSHILAAVLVANCVHLFLPDFKIVWRVDRTLVHQMLISGVPLVLLMGLSLIYQRAGILALSWIGNDAMMGQFSAATRLVEALKIIPAAVLGAMFPALARDIKTTQTNRGESEAASFHLFAPFAMQHSLWLIAFALFSAIGLCLLADPIIRVLFGSAYAPAAPLLRLMGWSLIPYVVGAVLSLQLVAAHYERDVLIAVAMTLPVALVLYTILITEHGLIGASEAAIISESLQAALLLILVRRH